MVRFPYGVFEFRTDPGCPRSKDGAAAWNDYLGRNAAVQRLEAELRRTTLLGQATILAFVPGARWDGIRSSQVPNETAPARGPCRSAPRALAAVPRLWAFLYLRSPPLAHQQSSSNASCV